MRLLPWRLTPGPWPPRQRAHSQAPTPTPIRGHLRAKCPRPHSSTRPPSPRISSPFPEPQGPQGAQGAQSLCEAAMIYGPRHQCPCRARLVVMTAGATATRRGGVAMAHPRAPTPCRCPRPAAHPPTWTFRGGIRAMGGRGASSTPFSRHPRSENSARGGGGA